MFVCMTKVGVFYAVDTYTHIYIHIYIHTCVDSGLSQNFASLSLHSPLVFNNSAAPYRHFHSGRSTHFMLSHRLTANIHTYVHIVNISYVHVIVGWLHFYFYTYIHTYIHIYIQQCHICAKFIYT